MNELRKDEKSSSILTLQYDIENEAEKSRRRHGWAPAEDNYKDEIDNPRPVSFSGRAYDNVILCILSSYYTYIHFIT